MSVSCDFGTKWIVVYLPLKFSKSSQTVHWRLLLYILNLITTTDSAKPPVHVVQTQECVQKYAFWVIYVFSCIPTVHLSNATSYPFFYFHYIFSNFHISFLHLRKLHFLCCIHARSRRACMLSLHSTSNISLREGATWRVPLHFYLVS